MVNIDIEDKLRKVLKEERKKEHERKAEERERKAEERERKADERNKAKPLNVDEVAKWGAQILESLPFVTLEDNKEMWMYTGTEHGYYTSSGETFLEKLCATCGDNRACDPGVLRKLTLKIRGSSYKKRSEFVHPEGLINLRDGVFDLNQEKLLEHSHNYYFKGVLNIPYDKNAKYVVWETIKNMFEDEEDYIKFQKWIGYHFVEENVEQKALGLFGESDSGKSQVLKILRDLLGRQNVTNFGLQDFANSSTYSLGRLYGKIANINFDMSQMPIRDIDTIKKLISGDPIWARNIWESPFELENHAKITWACNKLPFVSDHTLQSKEFVRRFMLIKTHIGYIKKKKHIYNEYLSELKSGGIFNWVIEGYKLYKKEGFKDEDIYSKWKEHMDIEHAPKEKDKDIGKDNTKNGYEKVKTETRTISDPDELNNTFGIGR